MCHLLFFGSGVRYRKIFAAFRAETQGVSGRGRSNKGKFSVLQYREGEEHKRRQTLKSGYELMTQPRYTQYFTQEVPEEDQLTIPEARLGWVRDKRSGAFEQDRSRSSVVVTVDGKHLA